MTRYRAAIILIVLFTGVFIAVRMAKTMFSEREEQVQRVIEGKPPFEPVRAPAVASGPPPLARSKRDADEVLAVFATDRGTRGEDRKVVSIRGTGSFVRLPTSPDEPGPTVTGALDTAVVDALMTAVASTTPAPTGAPYRVVATLQGGQTSRPVTAADAARWLRVSGRSLTRNALPRNARVRTIALDDVPANAIAWPLLRPAPEACVAAPTILPDNDPDRLRTALERLQENVVVVANGRAWRIIQVDLLPP